MCIRDSDILIAHVKPIARENASIFQFYNPISRNQTMKVSLDKSRSSDVTTSNIYNEKLDVITGQIEIPAFGTRFIRLDWK